MEQKVTNSSTQMQNVMQSLRDNMDELKDFWSKHSGRWDETEKHLGDVLDKVNQQIEETRSDLQKQLPIKSGLYWCFRFSFRNSRRY